MACFDIYSELSLGYPRGNLEDDLEELLGQKGRVTGGGQGHAGWNIDLEIFDDETSITMLHQVLQFLRDKNVPEDTYIVYEEQAFDVYSTSENSL